MGSALAVIKFFCLMRKVGWHCAFADCCNCDDDFDCDFFEIMSRRFLVKPREFQWKRLIFSQIFHPHSSLISPNSDLVQTYLSFFPTNHKFYLNKFHSSVCFSNRLPQIPTFTSLFDDPDRWIVDDIHDFGIDSSSRAPVDLIIIYSVSPVKTLSQRHNGRNCPAGFY